VNLGRDPLTGRREQVTRRGLRTASEAGKARREQSAKVDRGQLRPSSAAITIDGILDLYLDGIDADERLSAMTRIDYRRNPDDYVRHSAKAALGLVMLTLGPVTHVLPHERASGT
jgi:hypothetical protein